MAHLLFLLGGVWAIDGVGIVKTDSAFSAQNLGVWRWRSRTFTVKKHRKSLRNLRKTLEAKQETEGAIDLM